MNVNAPFFAVILRSLPLLFCRPRPVPASPLTVPPTAYGFVEQTTDTLVMSAPEIVPELLLGVQVCVGTDRLGLDCYTIPCCIRNRQREREGTIRGNGQVIRLIVLKHEAGAGQSAYGAAHNIGIRGADHPNTRDILTRYCSRITDSRTRLGRGGRVCLDGNNVFCPGSQDAVGNVKDPSAVIDSSSP